MIAIAVVGQEFNAVRNIVTHQSFLGLVSNTIDAECTLGMGKH